MAKTNLSKISKADGDTWNDALQLVRTVSPMVKIVLQSSKHDTAEKGGGRERNKEM